MTTPEKLIQDLLIFATANPTITVALILLLAVYLTLKTTPRRLK
jgi:hypothetical protein